MLYKLDSRIEHILVDEAQDTSPDQWTVVKAIAEDFFSGEGASQKPRTIFAVGDDKQSIFRFQGAVPWMLAEMQRFFAKKAEDARDALRRRGRSSSPSAPRARCLTAVDAVFKDELAAEITAVDLCGARLLSRPTSPATSCVLPRVVRKKSEEPEDWTEPYDAPSAAETELAGRHRRRDRAAERHDASLRQARSATARS